MYRLIVNGDDQSQRRVCKYPVVRIDGSLRECVAVKGLKLFILFLFGQMRRKFSTRPKPTDFVREFDQAALESWYKLRESFADPGWHSEIADVFDTSCTGVSYGRVSNSRENIVRNSSRVPIQKFTGHIRDSISNPLVYDRSYMRTKLKS